jgi:hypothetical protein
MHVYAFLPVKGVRVRHGLDGCSCPGLHLPLNTIRPYPFIQFVLEIGQREANADKILKSMSFSENC